MFPTPDQITGTDWLAQRAQDAPASPALLFGDETWSYAELDTRAERLAGSLSAAGVRAGQHVAVLLRNGPEYIVLIHALIRLRAVLVPLNLRLAAGELRWQIGQSDSDWLVHDGHTAQACADVGQGRWQPLELSRLPAPTAFSVAKIEPDAPFAILYTSGTTGRPKGVVQSLANHFWSAVASALRLGTLPNDRWLLNIPLYHVGGLAIPLRCCLYGTCVVLPLLEEHFDPQRVLAEMERTSVTLVSLVPTMLQRLLDAQAPFPPSLRLILLGGAPSTPKLLARAAQQNLPVACTYGLTETTSQIATCLPAETVRKPGNAGKALMFSQIVIVDEQDREVSSGQVGEIAIQGPTVMLGYYRQNEASAQAMRGGALHTGDLGYRDAEGDLWIVQRRADLIVSGGENIYPAEVERVLLEHPAVREACVVGVEDAEWGQTVAAAVALQPGGITDPEELQAFCRRSLAGYKLPRSIRILPELPHTASGKIEYAAVRRLWS